MQGSPKNPFPSALNFSIHCIRSKVDFAWPRYHAVLDFGLGEKLRILESLKDAIQMTGLEAHRTFRSIDESNSES